jgi:hypothetical protein
MSLDENDIGFLLCRCISFSIYEILHDEILPSAAYLYPALTSCRFSFTIKNENENFGDSAFFLCHLARK